MIITRTKDARQLLESLAGYGRIFLVGCGECSTTCSTGGIEEVKAMAAFLSGNGKIITGTCVPKAPCVASGVKSEIATHLAAVRDSDAVLVLACGLGVQSFKENNRYKQPVIPALDTVCGAVLQAGGAFKEACSMCGDCLLAETHGLCPITLCPKSLTNGPCGGVSKGKCEVNRDRDCVWALIYRESERTGSHEVMRKRRPARDFRKSVRPHTLLPPAAQV